jgi:hypothetical protein
VKKLYKKANKIKIGGIIMKPTNISKKLKLNKNTIANMINADMNKVRGGLPPTYGVNSCITICHTVDGHFCIGWVCNNPSEEDPIG